MPDKKLSVTLFHFEKGEAANFEGSFTMDSSDPKLHEIKKEINRATIEVPKYQLLVTTAEGNNFQVKDCWIDKIEFEKDNYGSTVCYFFSNDVTILDPAR